MKKLILNISIIISGIFLINCLGDDSPEIYTLTGTLYYDCTDLPADNLPLLLWGYDGSVFVEDVTGVKGSATTDENGKFSISYEKVPRRVDLSLETNNGINSLKVLLGIPDNENTDLGDVFISNRGRLKVILDVSNNYSGSDTLNIFTRGGSVKYFGSFSSGILDTIVNIRASPQSFNQELFNQVNNGYHDEIEWMINRDMTTYKSTFYYPRGCGTIDEITLKIE